MTCFRRMSCVFFFFFFFFPHTTISSMQASLPPMSSTIGDITWLLKYFACRDTARWNTKEAITSKWRVERAQLGAFFVEFQLPVTWSCIKFLKHLLPACFVRLLQSSSWGNVLAWSLCHVSWVYADSQFLGCFYNDHAVHLVCWLFLLLDHASILHHLEFFPDTIMECYWHLSRSMYYRWTLGSNLILYSPGRQPNPLNESAYSSVI